MDRFNWNKYIDLAEKSLNTQSEAHFRTSISRAYYGALISARNIIDMFHGTEIHQKIPEYFESINKDDTHIIAESLVYLRIHRNSADYDNIFRSSNLKETAQECLQRAQIIMRRFGEDS
mgnify:CR=1 FL=1